MPSDHTSISKPRPAAAAMAGIMLLLTIVVCVAAGVGLGALIGAPVLAAIAGGFVGVIAGFALVYTRFKDL